MRKLSTMFLALCLLMLAACTPPPAEETRLLNVVLAESSAYDCAEHVLEVARGSDVCFTVEVHNGYIYQGVSYPDSEVSVKKGQNGESTVELTLKSVRYSMFVEIACEEVARTVEVRLAASDDFRCEEPVIHVAEGSDAAFTLFFREGSTFESVDYAGSFRVDGVDGQPDANGERRVVLVLEKIAGDTEVAVTSRAAPTEDEEIVLTPVEGYAVIGYALNGGRFTDGRQGRYYFVNNALPHGIHPNTSQGSEMEREGYLLTGWNTLENGAGTHIGLGSRAPVEKGETLLLYAEWTQETDASFFEYVVIDRQGLTELHAERNNKEKKLEELVKSASSDDRCAVITNYHGTQSTLVIPDMVGGYEVCGVAPLTHSNDSALQKIVFPKTMRYLMERAFLSCPNVREIVLSDNMHYIDYNAFGVNCPVSTIRINAATEPLNGTNESAQLANKLELLGRSGDGPRTVFFGSCATWYSIDAGYFMEQTGRNSYNLAVEGDTGILFQLDFLAQYLREGDTLVYNCDLGSPHLMMYDLSLDQRAFRMVEFNYDLLATLDVRRYDSVISALNDYLVTKYLLRQSGSHGSYADYLDYMTDRGDMGKLREGPTDNMAMYQPRDLSEIVGSEAFRKTEEMIRRFLDMGLDVYYGFGPICMDRLTRPMYENVLAISDLFAEEFQTMSAPLIHSMADVVWPIEDFYDQPYRLDTEASRRYTEIYIKYFLNL